MDGDFELVVDTRKFLGFHHDRGRVVEHYS